MFCFPNEETQKIYDEHKILKVLSHLFMTVRLKFIVTADKTYDLGEEEMGEVLLKFFLDNNNHKRMDLSSEFFEQFG